MALQAGEHPRAIASHHPSWVCVGSRASLSVLRELFARACRHGSSSDELAIDALKREAARLGANAIVLETVTRHRLVALFLAVAAQCVLADDPKDRPRVDARQAPGYVCPLALIKQHISGRVYLAYSVDAKGKANRISVLDSDDDRLDEPAIHALEAFRFTLPPNWVKDGGPWRRLQVHLGFAIQGSKPLEKLGGGEEEITFSCGLG